MIGYIIGLSILLVPGTKADQNAWIDVLLSIFGGMLFFLAGLLLSIRFQGKNLIQINDMVYATVLGGAELCGLRTYRPLNLPIGILMALMAMMNFKNITGNLFFAQQIYPLYAMPFQSGLPLLTLAIALIRGIPKNQKNRNVTPIYPVYLRF